MDFSHDQDDSLSPCLKISMNELVVGRVPLRKAVLATSPTGSSVVEETLLECVSGDPSEIMLCLENGRGELYINAVEIVIISNVT